MMNEEPVRASRTGSRTVRTTPDENLTLPQHSPPQVETTQRPCLRCLLQSFHRVVSIIAFPFMATLTVISLIMIVCFCIVPTLVCTVLGVCMYYCVMEDPIPLNLLLRYMFSPDPDEVTLNGANGAYPFAQNRVLIRSKLIVRTLVEISEYDSGGCRKSAVGGNVRDYPPKHPFPIKVATDSKCLHFSEPIVADPTIKEDGDDQKSKKCASNDSDDDGNDDDEGGSDNDATAVPYYQRLGGPEMESTRSDVEVGAEGEVQQDCTSDRGEVVTDDDAVDHKDDAKVVTDEIGTENLSGDVIANTDTATNLQTGQHPSCFKRCNQGGSEEGNDSVASCPHSHPPNSPTGNTEADYFGLDGDVRDRGTTCDICLLEYEVGDEVAWSPNLDCSHAYHKDCILDWLVRKPTCPNCRHDYMKDNDKDV